MSEMMSQYVIIMSQIGMALYSAVVSSYNRRYMYIVM